MEVYKGSTRVFTVVRGRRWDPWGISRELSAPRGHPVPEPIWMAFMCSAFVGIVTYRVRKKSMAVRN